MSVQIMPLRLVCVSLVCCLINACSVLGGPTPEQVKQMREERDAKDEQAKLDAELARKNQLEKAQQKSEMSQACNERLKAADKMIVRNPGDGRITALRISATGFGAAPKNYFPEAQRRLMTMRAAKVDAYRALAEVVGGLHIWGGSALSEMVLERDRYRSFVDTYVRGARIIAVDERQDGSYQASVEMQVDAQFLTQVLAFVDPMLASCIDEQDVWRSMSNSEGVVSSVYYSE